MFGKLVLNFRSRKRERERERERAASRLCKIFFSFIFVATLFFVVHSSVYASTTISTNITTDGQLGVGTSSPVGRLDVRGLNATTSIASISGSTNFATLVLDNTIGDLLTASSSGLSRLVITQSGNVGIGTTNPTYKLEVSGTGKFSDQLQIIQNADRHALYIERNLGGQAIRIIDGSTQSVANDLIDINVAAANLGDGIAIYHSGASGSAIALNANELGGSGAQAIHARAYASAARIGIFANEGITGSSPKLYFDNKVADSGNFAIFRNLASGATSRVIEIDNTGTGPSLFIDHSGASGNAVQVTNAGTGHGLVVQRTNTLSDGYGIYTSAATVGSYPIYAFNSAANGPAAYFGGSSATNLVYLVNSSNSASGLYLQGPDQVGIELNATTVNTDDYRIYNNYGGLLLRNISDNSTGIQITGTGDIYLAQTAGSVGIGTTNPGEVLEVNGGIRLNTATAKPTCNSSHRGTFWVTQGAAGVKDNVEVCAKDAADAYAWRTIY